MPRHRPTRSKPMSSSGRSFSRPIPKIKSAKSQCKSLVMLPMEKYQIDHGNHLMQSLDKQRHEGNFCDVIIHVGVKTYPAHRSVLAAFSPYFSSMFLSNLAESVSKDITIQDVTEEAMDIIMIFFYTSQLTVDANNVTALVAAASLFLIDSVYNSCISYLNEHLSSDNCLEVFYLADRYSSSALKERSIELASRHFCAIANMPGFLLLSVDQLSDLIQKDELHVDTESQVYDAVVGWIKHDETSRKQYAARLLSTMRLPLLDKEYLVNTVRVLFADNAECCTLVDQTLSNQIKAVPRKKWESVYAVCSDGWAAKQGWDITPSSSWGAEPALAYFSTFLYSQITVTVHNKLIYVVGNQCTENKEVMYIINPRTNICTTGPDITRLFFFFKLVACKEYLYLMGDTYDGSEFRRYDPRLKTWNTLTCTEEDHLHPALIDVNGTIYAFSGNSDGDDGEDEDPNYMINDGLVFRYHDDTDTWEKLACSVMRRSCHAAIMFQECVYIVGGRLYGSRTCTNVVERFDTVTNTVTKIGGLTKPRRNVSLVVLGNKLYATCGDKSVDGAVYDDFVDWIEVYNAAEDKWTPCDKLVIPSMGDYYDRFNFKLVTV